jgi:hypothetical protein
VFFGMLGDAARPVFTPIFIIVRNLADPKPRKDTVAA